MKWMIILGLLVMPLIGKERDKKLDELGHTISRKLVNESTSQEIELTLVNSLLKDVTTQSANSTSLLKQPVDVLKDWPGITMEEVFQHTP